MEQTQHPESVSQEELNATQSEPELTPEVKDVEVIEDSNLFSSSPQNNKRSFQEIEDKNSETSPTKKKAIESDGSNDQIENHCNLESNITSDNREVARVLEASSSSEDFDLPNFNPISISSENAIKNYTEENSHLLQDNDNSKREIKEPEQSDTKVDQIDTTDSVQVEVSLEVSDVKMIENIPESTEKAIDENLSIEDNLKETRAAEILEQIDLPENEPLETIVEDKQTLEDKTEYSDSIEVSDKKSLEESFSANDHPAERSVIQSSDDSISDQMQIEKRIIEQEAEVSFDPILKDGENENVIEIEEINQEENDFKSGEGHSTDQIANDENIENEIEQQPERIESENTSSLSVALTDVSQTATGTIENDEGSSMIDESDPNSPETSFDSGNSVLHNTPDCNDTMREIEQKYIEKMESLKAELKLITEQVIRFKFFNISGMY